MRTVIIILVAAALVGGLFMSAFGESTYYIAVAEAVNKPDDAEKKPEQRRADEAVNEEEMFHSGGVRLILHKRTTRTLLWRRGKHREI